MDENIYRMFGYGIPHAIFEGKYIALFSSDTKEGERIDRAAQRMLMAKLLRYRTTIQTYDLDFQEQDHVQRLEWPSLEIFLLFTCIDALASFPENKHEDFPKWLTKQPGIEPFTLADIRRLHERYNDEQGVGANLRRLFNNLPPSAIEWLTNSVTILTPTQDHEATVVEDSRKIMKYVLRYYYDTRRNPFAHHAKSKESYVTDHIHPTEASMRLIGTMSEFDVDKKKNTRGKIMFHEGIDEATILRVIIRIAVLQKLDIEVTPQTIETYVQALSRESVIYGLIQEMKRNASLLGWWRDFKEDEKGSLYTYLAHAGIPTLDSYWSSNAIIDSLIVFPIKYPLQKGLYNRTLEYKDAVDRLNAEIEEFNKVCPPSGDNWADRQIRIGQFLKEQLETEAFQFVEQMPLQSEMGFLRLLARDPSSTPP